MSERVAPAMLTRMRSALTTSLMRAVLDAGQHAAMVVDESESFCSPTHRQASCWGYLPGELDGQSVELLLPERFRLAHIGHRLRFTDARRARPMGAGQALVVCCKNGCERRVRISLSCVQQGLETLVVAILVEVEEWGEGQATLNAGCKGTA